MKTRNDVAYKQQKVGPILEPRDTPEWSLTVHQETILAIPTHCLRYDLSQSRILIVYNANTLQLTQYQRFS